MKHPNPEHWSDFVRGLLDPRRAATLQSHLDQGCSACAGQVQALEAVRRVAETRDKLLPPAKALQSVFNLFRVQKLIESRDRPRFSLELTFDSSLSAAPLGVRGSLDGERRMVFRSPELEIDLRLLHNPATEPLIVEGQLLDSDQRPLRDVPALLVEGDRVCFQDVTSPLGDFRLEPCSKGPSQLCLVLPGDRLVEVELGDLGERFLAS